MCGNESDGRAYRQSCETGQEPSGYRAWAHRTISITNAGRIVAVSPNVHVLLDHVLTQFRGLLQELRNTQLFVCLRNRWKLRSGPATNDQDKHRWTKCFTLVNDGPHRCSS